MRGVRFYLEYDDKAHRRRGEHEGNVLAVEPDTARYRASIGQPGVMDAYGAIFYRPNSPVGSTAANLLLLQEEGRVKRISEKKAREIHPNLFAFLDQSED